MVIVCSVLILLTSALKASTFVGLYPAHEEIPAGFLCVVYLCRI